MGVAAAIAAPDAALLDLRQPGNVVTALQAAGYKAEMKINKDGEPYVLSATNGESFFVEALVDQEFELGGIFQVHPPCDLRLEIGGVGPERLEHDLLVLAEERLHEDGRVAQVGRHADFGDRDEMLFQHVVMHVAAGENVRQDVADLFADAQQADGAGFGRGV